MKVVDVAATIEMLAGQRKIFHSEADFQHALAWEIHGSLHDGTIRLEYPHSHSGQQMHIDIWVSERNSLVPIEVKFKTRVLKTRIGSESYDLKNQSAQDIGRYDFIKDIGRIEQVVCENHNSVGYTILLTNDSAYWKSPRKPNPVDACFRIHEGRVLAGTLRWQGAGAGTTRGRESEISLTGHYHVTWKDYSRVGEGRYNQFRYLLFRIEQEPPHHRHLHPT